MTAEKPNIKLDGRYSATETAKILDVSVEWLRRQANDGIISYKVRRSNNRRFYLGSEILRYWNSMY